MAAQPMRSIAEEGTSQDRSSSARRDFFGDIVKFATTLAELQHLREQADYNPSFSITADEAEIRIAEARSAVELFRSTEERQRVAFLALLLFNIRQTVPAL